MGVKHNRENAAERKRSFGPVPTRDFLSGLPALWLVLYPPHHSTANVFRILPEHRYIYLDLRLPHASVATTEMTPVQELARILYYVLYFGKAYVSGP